VVIRFNQAIQKIIPQLLFSPRPLEMHYRQMINKYSARPIDFTRLSFYKETKYLISGLQKQSLHVPFAGGITQD
jgi:hypothetical protein